MGNRARCGGSDGSPRLGRNGTSWHRRAEPVPPETAMNAPLRYMLQTFVPRHWFPLLPVALDELQEKPRWSAAACVALSGTLPDPIGRVLRSTGSSVYSIREGLIARLIKLDGEGERVLLSDIQEAHDRWATASMDQGAEHEHTIKRRDVSSLSSSGWASKPGRHRYRSSVSGTLLPPCNARFEPQDANRLWHIGSHIWSTI